jgi:hypothetical protein
MHGSLPKERATSGEDRRAFLAEVKGWLLAIVCSRIARACHGLYGAFG